MANTKKVNLGGRVLDGESIEFAIKEEPWGVYELKDGTKIRMRLIVSEVIRIKDAYTGEGEPLYLIKSSNVVVTDVPDELKMTPKVA